MKAGPNVDAEFTTFVSASGGRLLRAAYALTGAWSEAEDLTQDALTELYKSWRRLESLDAAYSYAKLTMTRMWVRRLRKKREVLWEDDSEAIDWRSSEAEYDVMAKIGFLELLKKLPTGQRAVLVFRYYLDYSVEDTAEHLGCTTGNVKSQSYKALRPPHHAVTVGGSVAHDINCVDAA